VLECSSLYETEPVGFQGQEWFVNAVLKISTELEPNELLRECHRIEKQLGRVRHPEAPKWGPRTIDIDILFYDDLVISEEELTIPHPVVHKRAFTLVPILELAPDMIHPTIGKSMIDLHSDLPDPEEVYLYGTKPKNF
jgi:2-amino-4-hydroxy-6-hydroxymethyldihydropteridine diphosphokinase